MAAILLTLCSVAEKLLTPLSEVQPITEVQAIAPEILGPNFYDALPAEIRVMIVEQVIAEEIKEGTDIYNLFTLSIEEDEDGFVRRLRRNRPLVSTAAQGEPLYEARASRNISQHAEVLMSRFIFS